MSVRPGTAFRTKGAVATSFMIFGTSFLFVTAHLTAHQEKVKERVGDVKKIAHSLDLPRVIPCKHKNKGNIFDFTSDGISIYFCTHGSTETTVLRY